MQLSVNDFKELIGSGQSSSVAPEDFGSVYKIVVLDRGFVVHGKVRRDGCYIVIDDCKCIRRWGTPTQDANSGLGHLAMRGPTPQTKLDPEPTCRVHELQVVRMIDSGGPWNAA